MQKCIFRKYCSVINRTVSWFIQILKHQPLSGLQRCHSFLQRLGLASSVATPFLQPIVTPKALWSLLSLLSTDWGCATCSNPPDVTVLGMTRNYLRWLRMWNSGLWNLSSWRGNGIQFPWGSTALSEQAKRRVRKGERRGSSGQKVPLKTQLYRWRWS